MAAARACPPGWTWVKVSDDDGNVLDEGWQYRKSPDRYEANGLAHLDTYVNDLLGSSSFLTSLMVATVDGEHAIGVYYVEGKVNIIQCFPPNMVSVEQRARALCKDRGYAVGLDYAADHGVRVIYWQVQRETTAIVEAIQLFARDIYGIADDAALDILLESREDTSEKYPTKGGTTFTITYPRVDPAAIPPQ